MSEVVSVNNKTNKKSNGNSKKALLASTSVAGIGDNSKLRDPADDVAEFKSMFTRAVRDETLGDTYRVSSEQRTAIALLQFYANRNPEGTASHTTMLLLDKRMGVGVFSQMRWDAFITEVRGMAGMVKPMLAKGQKFKSEQFQRDDAEYTRLERLLDRGFKFACDLLMVPHGAPPRSPNTVLSWFADITRGVPGAMVSVPWSLLIKRGSRAVGRLDAFINGDAKAKPPIPANDDYRVLLDGAYYSCDGESGLETFQANSAQVRLVAASHRVEEKTVKGKDGKDVKTVEPVKAVGARVSKKGKAGGDEGQKHAGTKAPNAPGGGRQVGSASEPNTVGMGLTQLLGQAVKILVESKPDRSEGPVLAHFWTHADNKDTRNSVNLAIEALLRYRHDEIMFEVTTRANQKLAAADLHEHEMKTYTMTAEPVFAKITGAKIKL